MPVCIFLNGKIYDESDSRDPCIRINRDNYANCQKCCCVKQTPFLFELRFHKLFPLFFRFPKKTPHLYKPFRAYIKKSQRVIMYLRLSIGAAHSVILKPRAKRTTYLQALSVFPVNTRFF